MTPEQILLGMFNQFKKGFYTSEFWLVAGSLVYTAISTAYDPSRPFSEQAVNLVLVGGAALYAFGRSFLKGKRVQAVASVSTGLNPGDKGHTLQTDEVPPEPDDTNLPPPITP